MSLKVAFLARFDLNDPRRSSGSYFHLVRAFRKAGHTVAISRPVSAAPTLVFRAKRKILAALAQARVPEGWDIGQGKVLAHDAADALGDKPYDYVLTNDNQVAAFLETKIPIVLITDTVFSAAVESGEFPGYAGLSCIVQHSGRRIQDRALARVAHAFYASRWAAAAAIDNHSAVPNKVHVVRFGANLEPRRQLRKMVPPSRDGCRVLFVGRDWRHKRGGLALEAIAELRRHGIAATLTLVGEIPARSWPEWVRAIGPLDMSSERQRHILADEYQNAQFFLLPSRAEGFGVVFSEAAAFGLPSIAESNTGIDTAVEEGETGVLLPIDSTARDYADVMLGLINSPEVYLRMSYSSIQHWKNKANWTVVAGRIASVLKTGTRSPKHLVEATPTAEVWQRTPTR